MRAPGLPPLWMPGWEGSETRALRPSYSGSSSPDACRSRRPSLSRSPPHTVVPLHRARIQGCRRDRPSPRRERTRSGGQSAASSDTAIPGAAQSRADPAGQRPHRCGGGRPVRSRQRTEDRWRTFRYARVGLRICSSLRYATSVLHGLQRPVSFMQQLSCEPA